MFASETFLGVKPASAALSLSDHLNRAGPGGTGAAKCGGTYAASLLAQSGAYAHGCDQMVFLDAVEHRCVDELGGMTSSSSTTSGC